MTSSETTWDGLPVAAEPPFGATVLVYRRSPSRLLMLHRAHHGPDYDGDWAWTPPSGSRQPGEDITACAVRELAEEAGISNVRIVPIDLGGDRWKHYGCELPASTGVRLVDPEHDRFEWLAVAVALARVRPDLVRTDLAILCERLGL
ncbi:MAG TPA: NUDIX domain-containing protein [Mycobacteriales bacterium]|nr:NUDIX domain-containing protein [Mycobacteriales bacterium]